MIKIEIEDTEIDERSGQNDKGPWTIRSQKAYAFLPGNKYPSETSITLERGQDAYAKGAYQLDPKSIVMGAYNSLQLRPKLVPLKG